LRISAGVWLTHEGSRYTDCADLDADSFWKSELKSILNSVRLFKNSTAILWWTVGNEMELEIDVEAGTECLWRRIDWLVRAVKAEDPDHPVGTVLAGAGAPKVKSIARLCQSLDFLGINTYGDSSLRVGSSLLASGWRKPYAITEFGPTGHWEAPLTSWGAYIEESSTQKAPRYLATCHACEADANCLGSFAFVWGWKWEKTGTWYGMFNEWKAVTEGVGANCTGCESETVAVMEQCWKGEQTPASPSLLSVSVDGTRLPGYRFSVNRSQQVQLQVEATHPKGHNLTAVWAVTEEIVSDAVGGAAEATNPLLSGLWLGSTSPTVTGLTALFDASGLPAASAYRLYVFVREDPAQYAGGEAYPLREASATLPFHICHNAVPGEKCYQRVLSAMTSGVHADPGSYPGVTSSSSMTEFQMALHQAGDLSCPMPCGLEEWCHTAVEGEQCFRHIQWAMSDGLRASPASYPTLGTTATFKEVQLALHAGRQGSCARPCAHSSGGNQGGGGDHTSGGAGMRLAFWVVVLLAVQLAHLAAW